MRKTHRIALFFSMIIVSLIIISSLYAAQQAKTYVSDKFNYSVTYPSDYGLRQLNNIIFFVSPKKDKKFSFASNVNIMVKDLDEAAADTEKYYAQAKKRLLKSLGEVKILEEKKEKINGRQAQKLVYTSAVNEATFKLMQVTFISGKKVYVITYTSLLKEYDNYLKQARVIINSFKILE